MPHCCETLGEDEIFADSSLAYDDPFTDSYATPHYQPRLPLRPTHLLLDLSFDIPAKTVKGRVTHTAIAQWTGAKTLCLNAEDFASVEVSSPDDGGLAFSYDGHEVHIILSISLKKGQKITIHVDYSVVHPIDGIVFSRERDGYFAVSDHETERARYWLPLVDHPVVRTTISFSLKTPASDDLVVLANGDLISEHVKDGVKVTNWEMKQITPSYLLCVAIGKFVVADAGEHNGKKINFYAPIGGRFEYSVENLSQTFGRTNEMIEFMENKVKYELPWSKYYQWACGEIGGAMENSSLVSYDEWYMLDERSAPERSHRVDSTVVHELAHTWFGDTVVCSDFCHSFLKESFATLISAEWYHHKNGNDDFQYTLKLYSDSSFSETHEYMRPIVMRTYETSWSLFDRHLYTNGAWRLHMLRTKLGDEIFWNAVSWYLHKRSWQTVETDDFRKDLEEYTGEQLCSYFDQWFYSKGHPILEGSFSYDASNGGTATVSVRQTQEDSKKGIKLFDLTIDVAIETSTETWETHTITMNSGSSSGQVIVKLPHKPLQVVLDPEKSVLHSLSKFTGIGDDMNMRALVHAPTFNGRHQGAKMLHDSRSRRGREALHKALTKEKHWGLRIVIARGLGQAAHPDSLSFLINAALTETDARVVPSIIAAIGEFKNAESEEFLMKFADEGDANMRPYGAIASAIWSLSKMRKTEHISFLTSFVEDEKKRGRGFEIPHAAALGLGQIRDWEAVKVLMRNADPPNLDLPARARGGIIRGIGNGVTWEGASRRMQAFEFLEKICRSDEVSSVRIAAGSVLAGLGDAGNPSRALEQLEKSLCNQSKPKVRGMMKRARKNANGREGATKAMGGMIEKLQKTVTEMKAKIETLESKLEEANMEKKSSEKLAVTEIEVKVDTA